MRSANIRYLPQIDHLRAFAAIWIVLYHGLFVLGPTFASKATLAAVHSTATGNPLYALWAEGHTAVALFMVLSGFIFTTGSFGKAISYKDFILNRILRIYPLYVAVLLLALSDDRMGKTLGDVVTTLLPLDDVRWEHGQTLVPMSWAVSVEFQFYLLYPFLLSFLNRAPLRTTAGVIGAALAFRMIGIGVWANPRDMAYYHLVGRIDQFALGMFAATLYLRWNGRERLFRAVFSIALPATVLLLWAYQSLGGGFDSASDWKIIWPTAEGCAWSAVVLGYVGMRQCFGPALSRLIGRIGAMSFSIYLLHLWIIEVFTHRPWMVLRLTSQWDLNILLTTVLLVLPVTLAVSSVTYEVIEKPFLSLRRRYFAPADAPAERTERGQAPGDLARRLLGSEPVVTGESAVASTEAVWSHHHEPETESSRAAPWTATARPSPTRRTP